MYISTNKRENGNNVLSVVLCIR